MTVKYIAFSAIGHLPRKLLIIKKNFGTLKVILSFCLDYESQRFIIKSKIIGIKYVHRAFGFYFSFIIQLVTFFLTLLL